MSLQMGSRRYPKLLLHNLKFFDGVDDRLQDGQVLIIEDRCFKCIDSVERLAKFPGHKIIDLQGKTILPGLIDNHVHIEPPKRGKDMNDYLKILLGLQHPRELERL